MKRSFLVAVFLLITGSAHADDGLSIKPYIGAGYDYVSANAANGGTLGTYNGADIHLGTMFGEHFGLEFGYLTTANTVIQGITTNVHGFVFDGMGYLPITTDKTTQLVGTIGLSDLTVHGTSPAGTAYEYEVGFRAGGGLQYWLDDHLNVRGMLRYQTADFSGYANGAFLADLGLNYQF